MHVKVGDVRLFFDVEGSQLVPEGPMMRERPTLICLHGGPGLDHSSLRPALAPLSRVAQVVYLDQRGHGRSGWSDPPRWTLGQWAQDLHDFIDALGIIDPIVFGTSFGGGVAMAYGIHYPDHPAKLILLSTSARGTGNVERQASVFEAFGRLGGARAGEAVRRLFRERTPEAYADYIRLCGPLYNRVPPDPQVPSRAILNEAVLPFFERPGGEGATFDLSPELASIRCPTLVIGGEEDPITPISEQQKIAEDLPVALARFERFPSCGHGVWRDNSAGLCRVVEEFICA